MPLFSGKAFFSPAVPRALIAAWVQHGGSVVHTTSTNDSLRIADYVFYDGPHDPWLEFVDPRTVAMHARWVWTSVQERFLMPIARFVLDDYFKPLDEDRPSVEEFGHEAAASTTTVQANGQRQKGAEETIIKGPSQRHKQVRMHPSLQQRKNTRVVAVPVIPAKRHAESDSGPGKKRTRFANDDDHKHNIICAIKPGRGSILDTSTISTGSSSSTSSATSLPAFASGGTTSDTSMSSAGFGTDHSAASGRATTNELRQYGFDQENVVVDPRTAFLNAVYTQTRTNDNSNVLTPVRVRVEALLESARGAPPSGAVLFVVNEAYEGKRFRL